MSTRVRHGLVVAFCALVFAACAPIAPPAPPKPTLPPWCDTNTNPPDVGAHFAVVEDAAGAPRVVTFQADTPAEVQQEVAQLEKTGEVTAVEQDKPVQAVSAVPSDDPNYRQQWGFTASEADFVGAWAAGYDGGNSGSPVRVAVIDTGVWGNHPDLDANVVPGKDFVTSDAASNFARIDGNGHGTHVAGTIAAEDNAIGVVGGAPRAVIVPTRVLNCSGSGTYSAVVAGILWASDPGPGGGRANVINLSLGGSSRDTALEEAIDTAVGRGVVVVAAAGNGGPTAAPLYPAAYPKVIAVGAKDQTAAVAARLPGDGGRFEMPSTPGNSLAGDFEFVARVQADSWTPSLPQVIASKLDATSGFEPLRLNADGKVQFSGVTTSGPQVVVSAKAVEAAKGQPVWLRVRREAGVVSFFKALNSSGVPALWTNLGAVGPNNASAVVSNANNFVIGDTGVSGMPFSGFVLYAELRELVLGVPSTTMTFKPESAALGAGAWAVGPWTPQGGATVVNGAAYYSNTNSYVDVVAPGSGIVSTLSDGSYGSKSGTSMATPHVAAVAALIKEACGVAYPPAKVVAKIQNSSRGPVAGFAAVNESVLLLPVGLLKAGAATAPGCP